MTSIDIKFNMFSDTPKGKDPDTFSKTLNLYHQKLWSKKLPNGKIMYLQRGVKKHKNGSPRQELTVEAKAIAKTHPRIDSRQYVFTSDALGLTFKNKRNKKGADGKVIEQIFQNLDEGEHEKYFKKCCTIGAYTVFPGYMINRRQTINQARGFNPFILDRIDLTLECVRLFYLNTPGLSKETCPLLDTLNRYKPFFDLFETFKGYIEYFLFQDLVNNDFSEVLFFHPFHGFKKKDFPKNIKDYRAYMNKMIKFIELRNSRILDWATNH